MREKEYTAIGNTHVKRMPGSARVECSIHDLEKDLASLRAIESRGADVSGRIAQVIWQLTEYRTMFESLRKRSAKYLRVVETRQW
jgi:hypothetical protein